MKVFLHTGSNLGDQIGQLLCANTWIAKRIGSIITTSSFYISEAWGVEDQPDFYNQALEIQTDLSPMEVLEQIHWIEAKMGRIRKERWGIRCIDIDILFYAQEIVETKTLIIPHIEFANRNFALLPMLELAPDWQHPKLNLSIAELYAASTDPLLVTKLVV